VSSSPTWWLIDGYNLLFRWAGYPDGPQQLTTARHDLLRAIERWADVVGDRVTVVFDSRREVPEPAFMDYGVEIVFASADLGADAWIEHAVGACRNRDRCKVVSSDLRLRQNVEAAGASSMGCGDFFQALRSAGVSHRPPPSPRPTLGDLFPDLGDRGPTNNDHADEKS